MCGRYGITSACEEFRDYFGLVDFDEFDIHYNIGPQTLQPVISSGAAGDRVLRLMKWGLVPSWAKDPKVQYSTFNARAEEIHLKAAFRDSFQRRRCILPANVFYEWKRAGRTRQPYAIRLKSGEPLALAGVWDRWEATGPDTAGLPPLESFSIITTEANAVLKPIHSRMPVLLRPEDFARWLSSETASPLDLLQPFDPDRLEVWPVDARLGNVQNDHPSPSDHREPEQLQLL